MDVKLLAGGIPRQMAALVKRRDQESYEFDPAVDVATPAEDEVLIRVDLVGICGSDIALYRWGDFAKSIASIPFIPGHECTGTVVLVGTAVDGTLRPGDRVAVENHFYCGLCYQCLDGRGDICQDMGQYGHGRKTQHGGCSQYSVVPARYCYKITTDISTDEAVLMEPMGVAHNALERLGVSGEDVLILGCGPIGLIACAVAKAMGATRVLAADISASRLSLAKSMGADVVINTSCQDIKQVICDETHGNGVGRICEMSGSEDMLNNLFALLRKGGHVTVVGLPKKPLHIDNVVKDFVMKSLELHTVHGRRIFHTWKECERLLSTKQVNILPVVSHHLPMREYETAFNLLFTGEGCKVLLNPQI